MRALSGWMVVGVGLISCGSPAPDSVVLHNGKGYTAVRGKDWAQRS